MAKNKRLKQLSAQDISLFCDQIALVLHAGIALYDAMSMLRESYAGTAMENKIDAIDERIRETGSLYEAMESAGCFPSYAVYMVRIGERSGNLESIMTALSDYYAWEDKVRGAVRNAVFYPAMLIAMMAAVIVVLITSVFPVFTQVYESLGVGLSRSSQMVVGLSLGFGRGVLIVAVLLVAAIAAVALLMRSNRRAHVADVLMRAFPPVRRALDKIESGRIALALSMLMTGGYPLEEALSMVQDVLTDSTAREKVRRCCELMEGGASFAAGNGRSETLRADVRADVPRRFCSRANRHRDEAPGGNLRRRDGRRNQAPRLLHRARARRGAFHRGGRDSVVRHVAFNEPDVLHDLKRGKRG